MPPLEAESASTSYRHRSVVRLRRPGQRWLVLAELADLLFGPEAPRWFDLPDGARDCVAVKLRPMRRLWRVTLGGQEFYAKLYRGRGLWERLVVRLGRVRAQQEWRAARFAIQHGVSTAEPLAVGLADDGSSMLITRSLGRTQTLYEALQQGAVPARRLCEAVAELLATSHRVGLYHADLHGGNILLRRCGDEGVPEVLLMDLRTAAISRPLRWRLMRRDLVMLAHDQQARTDVRLQLRFLRWYLRAVGSPVELAEAVRQIRTRLRHYSARLWRSRQRRAMRTSRYTARLRLPGRLHARVFLRGKWRFGFSPASGMSFEPHEWAETLKDLDSLLQGEPVKRSRSVVVVRRRLQLGDKTLEVYCKRFVRCKIINWLFDCFRPSRAMRCWRCGHGLLARSIPTALPLAAVDRRFGPVLLDSVLVTEAVEAVRLDQFVSRIADTDDRRQRWRRMRQLSRSLAALLRDMHQRQVRHRDFKPSNVLVRTAAGGQPEPVLIDLLGVRFGSGWLSGGCRFFGGYWFSSSRWLPLLRLNIWSMDRPEITLTDRLRLLRMAAGDVYDWKPLWRCLQRRSERRSKAKARRRAQGQSR